MLQGAEIHSDHFVKHGARMHLDQKTSGTPAAQRQATVFPADRGGLSRWRSLSPFFFFPLSFPSCCIWLNLFPFSVCLFSGLERFYFLLTSLVPLYIVTFQLYFSWLITLFSVFSFPRKRLGLWLGCCFYCYKPHQRSLLSSWVRCLHLVKRPWWGEEEWSWGPQQPGPSLLKVETIPVGRITGS